MKMPQLLLVILASSSMCLASCGSDKKGCTGLCEELRPKLIEQMPDVSPEDVRCSEPPWTLKDNCDDCLQILIDLFDASPSEPDDLCRRHFG
jgi:hypothetical protein